MIVVLAESVFSPDSPDAAVELMVLIANSRHVVFADTEAPAYKEWVKSAGAFGIRMKNMLAVSSRLIIGGASQNKINVHVGLTNWNTPVPTLSIDDARLYLPIPFKIFVENNDADRAFLLSLLDYEKREYLLELQIKHWLVFVHGGGTGDLQKQIVWEAENTMRADLRSFAYFDNDGLVPGQPSRKTVQIATECTKRHIHYHQLTRRAIENYIPFSGLELWASLQSNKRARYTRRQLTHFKKLSVDERDYFNMKTGHGGDGISAVPYPILNQYELRFLKKGFGLKLATIFQHPKFRDKADRKDFQRAVVEIENLYALLRKRI